ncbi:hypothetical protein ACS79_20320 [Vibrio lentus]|nr:hypothetical protein ACS79_20320 [Vibrio lentus]
MSEKSMLDSFNVVDENGESQFQTVDELGNLNNFYVNVPWDEVREKALQSQSVGDQTKEIINETLLEHSGKINDEIAEQVNRLNPEDLDAYQSVIVQVLKFYFDNQDAINFIVDTMKQILLK